VIFAREQGTVRSIGNHTGFISESKRDVEPADRASEFVRSNLPLLGLAEEDISTTEVIDTVRPRINGVTNVYVRRLHAGIPVYQGQLQVAIDRDGRIQRLNNGFVPSLSNSINSNAPTVNAAEAVLAAAAHLGISVQEPPNVVERGTDPQQTVRLARYRFEPIHHHARQQRIRLS